MPTTTRKPHSKSRHGCLACKERKIKCDEVRPTCGKCARRGSVCSFSEADSSPLIFVDGPNSRLPKKPVASTSAEPPQSGYEMQMDFESTSTPAEYGQSQSDSMTSVETAPTSPNYYSIPTPSNSSQSNYSASRTHADPAENQRPSFTPTERDNLRLMRHYTIAAYCAASSSPEQLSLWQDSVPELSFDHPFLLHSILAFSALHRAVTTPNLSRNPDDPDSLPSLAALARHHHVVALPPFRAHLADLSPDMLPVLFATAALIALYTFGNPLLDELIDPSIKLDVVSNMAEILFILHGTGIIVKAGLEQLKQTPFKSLLLPWPSDPDAALAEPVETALDRLKMRCYSRYSGILDDERPAYERAITLLRNSFVIWLDSAEQMTAVPFAVLISDLVLNAMREEKPLALCILANYAVILHWLKNKSVWMGPWGRRTVESVAAKLGEPWKLEMQWALQEVAKEVPLPSGAGLEAQASRQSARGGGGDSGSSRGVVQWQCD